MQAIDSFPGFRWGVCREVDVSPNNSLGGVPGDGRGRQGVVYLWSVYILVCLITGLVCFQVSRDFLYFEIPYFE